VSIPFPFGNVGLFWMYTAANHLIVECSKILLMSLLSDGEKEVKVL
jgi:hypothetical protein